MTEKAPIRVVVELERTGEPISGAVCADGESRSQPFSGWIQLAAALEAARAIEGNGQRQIGGAEDPRQRIRRPDSEGDTK